MPHARSRAQQRIARARLAAAAALALLALTAGCSGAREAAPRPTIVVSVPPQAWLVERLVGDAAEIVVMIPPGASPATFEPELGQLRALSRASLYVKVGHPHFPFEATWIDRLLADHPELRVIDLSLGEGSGDHDPHLWLSPARVAAMIEPLAEALKTAVPDAAGELPARSDALQRDVAATDAALRSVLASARGKSFLSVHAAWGHLAADYGLIQIAVEQDNKAPDPHRLTELIDRARALGIPVVFAQPQFDPASAELIAAELGARVEWIDPLARDWADNLVRVAKQLAAATRETAAQPDRAVDG